MSIPLEALGRVPIPGADPAGQPSRYTPEFERLEAEITKLSSLTGGDIDWHAVANDAIAVLSTRSKDLLAAVYLARAWYALEGATGLARGLTVVRDLLTTYWDTLQPAVVRLRARRAALLWLSDGLSPLLETEVPDARWSACLELAQALEADADPRFPDNDSGLGGVRRGLARLAAVAVAGTPLPGAAPTSEATTPTASAASTGASGDRPIVTGQTIADRTDALRRLQELAQFFQRTEPHGPIGYLIQRAVKWGDLSFQELYVDLLANHSSAQGEIWHVLGLPRPGDGGPVN
jgi:type VI secretion system protein VasJ